MNIALIDDNNKDVENLNDFVKKYFEDSLIVNNVTVFSSGEEFLKSEITEKTDVVFLDIFLEQHSGIDVAKKLRESSEKCMIVFVSSSNNFARESYEVGATSYLVKPYTFLDFSEVMKKVDAKVKSASLYFDVEVRSQLVRILMSKILYVDYSNHYVQFHTEDDMVKSYTVTYAKVRETLSKYRNFVCCYHNVTVNMDKVVKIEQKCFCLTNGENISINKTTYRAIAKTYYNYIIKKCGGGDIFVFVETSILLFERVHSHGVFFDVRRTSFQERFQIFKKSHGFCFDNACSRILSD